MNSQLVVKIADLELGLQGIEEETLINSQRAIMASWQAPEVSRYSIVFLLLLFSGFFI